ncbi:phosphatase PAP2 family protein [Streptomyces sp. MUM 178J]|uniref:phosphatase PAP2 family protein n=1 Tax=Streptomyces sp. MUM 178J TaxID=2791991 RepID=UPI001F044117|nr:phosphatase PAP2 family protein [Streptomyces sp. MUM 178J]WRQ78702.1 phosphatase PAP2 family protein [Streptomyces sp. MUM 178J]
MRTDIFARLDREPEPPKIEIPRMSRTRLALFGGTSAFYLAIVVAVLASTWLVALDWKVMLFRPYQQWPELHAFLDYFVVLGQRGPTAVMVAAWLGWRSWRQHTLRPLLVLGAALLLLNCTVGAVKLGLGRLGPHYATQIGSAELFAGGDIFPSGHTANAVVTWGILAYLATTPRARRHLSALSAVVSLGVGLTTVYLGTHWLSDVLLGWAAGLLIMLGLPWCEPLIGRAEAWIFAVREQWRARRRLGVPSLPVAAGGPRTSPAGAPGMYARPAPAPAEGPVREPETVSVGGGRLAPSAPSPTGRTSGHTERSRPHAVRSERTPVTPSGGRRPPHSRTVAGG